MELYGLLSKYSVDCVVISLISCFSVCLCRKYLKFSEKMARILPFSVALLLYSLSALMGFFSFEQVINKSMTAGGLATVIYASLGGYSLTTEEELKNLMSSILKSVVKSENIEKVTSDILQGLYKNKDEHLIEIKISDLIRANLNGETDEEKIKIVTAIFIKSYKKLSQRKKFIG